MKYRSFKYHYALMVCTIAALIAGGAFVSSADEFIIRPVGSIPLSLNQCDQLIVKYKDSSFVQAAAQKKMTSAMVNKRIQSLNMSSGIQLSHYRFMSGDGHVLKLPYKMTLAEARSVALSLENNSYVEYAEPDARIFALSAPNDTFYNNQWHYHSTSVEPAGINLPVAWDLTTGLSTTVVAVIDTGIVSHADLAGRTVAGYDFISDANIANDGDGRDSDPSDPGDWITSEESNTAGGIFEGCTVENSSWHGTHVAGTVGALTNNSLGVAGVNWAAKILPVRVLGKCGGYLSDVVDGMRWSAGLSVSGASANHNPAKILNLSLGGLGSCSYTMQSAINSIVSSGATVVVAAGNANINVSYYTPANCSGVISVAAVNRSGGRASYSNYGSLVKIAAPGGEGIYGILSTLNTGTTSPEASPAGDTYMYYKGTSMATPHVSGIASLILALNPSFTPGQILARLQSSAGAFPTQTGSDCTTSICGAGIVNAAAVAADVVVGMTASSDTATAGQTFTYTITVSSNGPGPGDDVTVTDTLPDSVTYVSIATSQGSCTATDTLTCNLGKVGTGSGATIILTVIPRTAGTINNTAAVSTTIYDTNMVNNTTSLTTAVEAATSSGDTATGGGGGGGGCFIATAAYGSAMEKHVGILREFRDRILLAGSAGRVFVRFYYKNSPSLAGRIAQSETLRFITRIVLMPVVGTAYLILACGADGVLMILLALLLATQSFWWGIQNRRILKKYQRSND